jgi:hypothetical protein
VNEVQVNSTDGHDELLQPVESRLVDAPVVLLPPIGRERPHEREIGTVLPSASRALVGPACPFEPHPQVGQDGVRNMDSKRTWRGHDGNHRLVSLWCMAGPSRRLAIGPASQLEALGLRQPSKELRIDILSGANNNGCLAPGRSWPHSVTYSTARRLDPAGSSPPPARARWAPGARPRESPSAPPAHRFGAGGRRRTPIHPGPVWPSVRPG